MLGEDLDRLANAAKTKQRFEEKLRQRPKEKEPRKKSKKKKARAPVSVLASGATEILTEKGRLREKKAKDGARSKCSAQKPIRRLTQELLLPLFQRRVSVAPVVEGERHPRATGSGLWECANCTYQNGLVGPELDAAVCAVCREPRGPCCRPCTAASVLQENARDSRKNLLSLNLCPNDNSVANGDGDHVSWDDLKNVLEQVRRDSLDEGWGSRVRRDSLDECWSDLEDVLEQVKHESSGGARKEVNEESLNESWNNLGDALEQAKRESLMLLKSYEGSLSEN